MSVFIRDSATSAAADRQSGSAPPRYRLLPMEWLLLASVLLLVAITRLYGIEDFPIYFFCDEAEQANLAEDLVANGLRDEEGNLAPAYFRNVRVFNLGLSVWIHALPITVFGKSIFVVRSTSVAVGLAGTAALMLALKWFFQVRLWWAGGLVLGVLPAWFLHSRTAFETVMMTSFYALFILFYLLYRMVSPWWASAAIVTGAATFYSYSNGQGVMFITCLLLAVTDWRYHWQVLTRQRKAAIVAVAVLIFVAAPYVRFRFFIHPEMMELHLADLNSYWTENIPWHDKLEQFVGIYLHGLSPTYWFLEDTRELVRHRMLGYAYFPMYLAPAIFLGFALSLWKAPRSPAHRLLLIAALAAPFSASLVGLRITRVLAMVVPVTLAAVVGLDRLRAWLARIAPEKVIVPVIGLGLSTGALLMTRDALANGPCWFDDYGMHGMQWGAKELFSEIRSRLEESPDSRFVISHSWANNTNAFGEFFLEPAERRRIDWGVIGDVLREPNALVGAKTRFVLTPDEFEQAKASPKLRIDPDWSIIRDPSDRPAFYIVTLHYTGNADALFRAEREFRHQRVEDEVSIMGEEVRVLHPRLDMGVIADAFDGDTKTLARTLDANPCELTLIFPGPRAVAGVRLHLWSEEYLIRLRTVGEDGNSVQVAAKGSASEALEPLEVSFDVAVPGVVELRIIIAKRGDVHIHLREIEILRDTPSLGVSP